MHWGKGFAALMLVLSLCAGRQAAASSTYALECNANMEGKITVQLSSFRVQVSPNAGGPATGLHQRPYELTVHFPAGRAYTAFHSAIDRNEVIHTCKLTETETGTTISRTINTGAPTGYSKPVDSLEWDFNEGTVTSVVAFGSDGTGITGNVVPQGSMQVIFTFQSLTVIAKP
jgi:hypothetical protein